MGLFKKTYPNKKDLVIEDRWSLAKASREGKSLIIRFNDALRKLSGHPDYGFQVGLAVPLRDMDEQDMPTDAESKKLHYIEDLIISKLGKDNEAILAIVLTGPNLREFVLYASNPDTIIARYQDLKKLVVPHELQLVINEDNRWTVFKSFITK